MKTTCSLARASELAKLVTGLLILMRVQDITSGKVHFCSFFTYYLLKNLLLIV